MTSATNIISGSVIRAKTVKLSKQALRDARKRIRKGELVDSFSLSLYLQTIDARFASIQSDISNAVHMVGYANVRAEHMARTRQLLGFFDHDEKALIEQYEQVRTKAAVAGRTKEFGEAKLPAIDTARLKAELKMLENEEV